jgi:eukaryotic-like serine/threonine-protein kinase
MKGETRILGGRYEVESRLGEGGMAMVFGGVDRLLGRKVAIKVLARHYARDRTAVERFRREAQAAAGLNHPNVVSVFDTGSDDGVHYIVMEHVDGTTLADEIKEHGPVPPGRAALIAVDVCRALASAHEKGMVHRDVKPGNVLLASDGSVKVTDFGIARVASSEALTATGSVMGTASYLSPEQARGGDIDARSDIYSLGCVLYEMLTGRPPFDGDTPLSIAYKHVQEDPPPPSSINPAVPADIESVVSRAMAKKPGDRFKSAAEMARNLQEAAPTGPMETAVMIPTGEATEVLPARQSPTRTAPLPEIAARQRRWMVAAAAAALAVLGVALAVTLGRERPLTASSPQPTSPATTSPPPASPTPPPTTPPPLLSLQEAVTQFEAALQGLDEDVQSELVDRANEALDRFNQGDQAGSLEKMGELRTKVEELTAEGRISAVQRDALLSSVAALEAGIQTTAPPETPRGDGGDGDED